jgi:hypothetical protein
MSQFDIAQLLDRACVEDKRQEGEIDRQNEGVNKVDQTPWLHRTSWLCMFVGVDMKALIAATEKPVHNIVLE